MIEKDVSSVKTLCKTENFKFLWFLSKEADSANDAAKFVNFLRKLSKLVDFDLKLNQEDMNYLYKIAV